MFESRPPHHTLKKKKKETTMKRTGPTNPNLQELIVRLKKAAAENKTPLWRRVALDLERPTRMRRVVNLSRINRFTKEGELVLVPGKVLGSGQLNHKLTIAAWCISGQALERVREVKGEFLTIDELLAKNPNGKKVRIIG